MMPRVSICIPVYEAERWLQETLDAVWAQDFSDFEVVAVDDGSSDGSQAILDAQDDPRLRVIRHERNQGQHATVNDAIAAARGRLVKFLDADDVLRADCLALMVRAMDAHPTAAFVFSARDVWLDTPDEPASQAWLRMYRAPHRRFGTLRELNDGRILLRRWIESGLDGNWIAEPAGVMARRSALARVGGYRSRVRHASDMDAWARLMAVGDVAFVDQPLYTYRFAFTGLTGASVPGERQWLDPLWSAEGLLPFLDGEDARLLRVMRRRLVARASRRALVEHARRDPTATARARDLAAYARYRAVALRGSLRRASSAAAAPTSAQM